MPRSPSWLYFFLPTKGVKTVPFKPNEKSTHQPVRRQHEYIPKPYYKICMDALRIFSRGNVSLAAAIQTACNASGVQGVKQTDARRYLLRWLKDDSKFE